MTHWSEGLLRPEAWDDPVDRVELHETHISWVFLVGEYAYKLKKPVDFGFINFTTPDLRRHFCEEEVRLNRVFAPELYLGVVPVYGPEDRPSLRGTGEPLDHLVKMQRFPQSAVLAEAVARGDVREAHWDRFAEDLARLHSAAASAEVSSPFGTPDLVRAHQTANLVALEKWLTPAEVSELRDWTNHEFGRTHFVMERRRQEGHIRECHGDLHLGNLLLRKDRIVPFDCLEFSPELRWLDPVDELAFLAMDLEERNQHAAAVRVRNGWLETTGDYEGLAVWKWYVTYRALVRAKVAALRAEQLAEHDPARESSLRELHQYVATARRVHQPRRCGLILTRGLSGSGKSFLAGKLAVQLDAVRVRSDVERKRLFGLWGEPKTAAISGDLYSAEVSQKLYRAILPRLARAVLSAGFSVIVDATFLRKWQRAALEDFARECGVPLLTIDVRVPDSVARERIVARKVVGLDPSDADLKVFENQLLTQEPLTDRELSNAVVVDGRNPDLVGLVQECERRGIEVAWNG
jgi:uncharacterized protein